MKKVARYIQLLFGEEKKSKREHSRTYAIIPTKLARKSKPSTMSLRKHRICGHVSSGSHNPRIKEAMKREAEWKSRPKHTIRELFNER